MRASLDLGRTLAVPELTDVEVARRAVEPVRPLPAEQDVARRLHQALALDDPLPVVLVPARAEVRLEDRGLGLLDLHQQRVVVVAAEQQDDPRPGADAADADDLAGDVDEP